MVREYNNDVFLNCPFDREYTDMLYAITYTVYHCGFSPRISLEENNALNNRLSKIENIIGECKYGIHDLSRIETGDNNMPRFNMPFEVGIFFGAKKFGNTKQKTKVALVLERHKYSFQQFISDLSGIDTQAHDNDPIKIVKIVRDWLQLSSGRKTIDGHLTVINGYNEFMNIVLPDSVKKSGMDINNLLFNDFCLMVESYLKPYLDS